MTRRDRTSLVRVSAFAAALAILSAAPSARADDEVDATTLRVERLADQAFANVERGAFAEALALYMQAIEVAPSSAIAFDIAWLYDHHLGSPALALDYYRRAVAAPDVTDELAARARGRIKALEAAQEARTLAASPATPARGPNADRGASWSPLRTWALFTGGTGLVALGVGAAFAIVAKNKDDQAGRYCDGDRCSDARALTLTDEATSAATVANVAIVTGAVLVAGGVTLWLIAPKRGAVDVSVRASAGAPSFVLGGTLP
ncbi:MAG: hypothetical protein JWP87_454 [Labilithrix sp.]|nr:hypothetical protein [Labilithrix sp.]